MRVVVAVDGGNSKTEVVVVRADGRVLGRARGPGFRPQADGVVAAVDVLAATAREAIARGAGAALPVDHVAAYLAGADLPEEVVELRAEIHRRGLGASTHVGNDTVALLRTGSASGRGVAVVCGAGVNALGVGPDGAEARFPALGPLTGDWGGGLHLGELVLWHAVRAEDGRGPATALLPLVRDHFHLPRAEAVALAVHRGELPRARLAELARPLFALVHRPLAERGAAVPGLAAPVGDPIAVALVERLAEEIRVLGTVLLDRLGLLATPADVVLGGGILTARPPALMSRIRAGYAEHAPAARLVHPTEAPVFGAARLGLTAIGADPDLLDPGAGPA